MVRKIFCSILTPERIVYEGEIEHIVVQGLNGKIGFLFNHCPIVSRIGVGAVKIGSTSNVEYMWIENGIVEMKKNKMIILAENAYKKEEIDKDILDKQLVILKEKLENLEIYSKEREDLQMNKKNIKEKINFIAL